MKLNNKFINSVIARVNPLRLPDAEGKGLVFHNMCECYQYIMDTVYDIAPLGYMDLYIIYAELYNASFADASIFYINNFKNVFHKRFEMVEIGGNSYKQFLRKLIVCLSNGMNTDFDVNSFESAYKLHITYIENAKQVKK